MAIPKLTMCRKDADTTWLEEREPRMSEPVQAANWSSHQIPNLRSPLVSLKYVHRGRHRGMACEGQFHQVLMSFKINSITSNQC